MGQASALTNIQRYLGNLLKDIPDPVSNLTINWNGNMAIFSFKAAKIPISGTLNVLKDAVEINSALPLVFFPLKSQIENVVKQHADSILK